MPLWKIIIGLILFWPAATTLAASPEFMSLKLLEHKKTRDGGQTAEYELRLPRGFSGLEQVEIYYVLKPWNYSRGSGPRFGPDEIYAQSLTGQTDSPRLTIYCGRMARLDIMAGAVIDGRFYLARTFLNTYGRSGRDDPHSRRVAARPDWPAPELVGGAAYYRAQAGEELRFRLEKAVGTEIFEEGRPDPVKPVRLEGDLYSHTPAAYPLFRAPAYSAARDLAFVGRTGDGAVLSYYLPVGRARYGHLYLKPGLLVVALSAGLALGAVKLAGRSFKWR